MTQSIVVVLRLYGVFQSARLHWARRFESISRTRKSARYMTVKVTVDGNMGELIASVYAGFQVQEIIEWEAEQPVSPPLVESLHANMDGGKAVIFMTHSVPLAE